MKQPHDHQQQLQQQQQQQAEVATSSTGTNTAKLFYHLILLRTDSTNIFCLFHKKQQHFEELTKLILS